MTDETFTYAPPAAPSRPVADALGTFITVATCVLFCCAPPVILAVWKALL